MEGLEDSDEMEEAAQEEVDKVLYELTAGKYSLLLLAFLARLFLKKSRAIVIARSLLSSSCKNFNVAHYSKSIKGINTKLGMVAHHDKMQLEEKGHNSESYSIFK